MFRKGSLDLATDVFSSWALLSKPLGTEESKSIRSGTSFDILIRGIGQTWAVGERNIRLALFKIYDLELSSNLLLCARFLGNRLGFAVEDTHLRTKSTTGRMKHLHRRWWKWRRALSAVKAVAVATAVVVVVEIWRPIPSASDSTTSNGQSDEETLPSSNLPNIASLKQR